MSGPVSGQDEPPRFVITQLAKHHRRENFSCGAPALDGYLKKQANQDIRRNVARVFVMTAEGAKDVLGYYTLSSISVIAAALPEAERKRLPRYPEIPAGIIGRLAVSEDRHGQGLGEFLLLDALARLLKLSREMGCFAALVDAKDERAKRFYTKFQFRPFPDTPGRLFLPMKSIEQMFA